MRGSRKIAWRIVGFTVFGLSVASFLLHVLWMIKSGHGGDTYYNYKYQPMTYWGAAATLALVAIVGIIGLYYWVKRSMERRRRLREQA